MRILFLADAVFEDIPGGSRVVARELALGLTRRGHAVTFLVARHGSDAPDERRDGVRIVRYGGAGRAGAFVVEGRRAAARLWAENPFDVVHTHFAYAALGPLMALPSRVPHVRTFHGPWHEEGWLEDVGDSTRPSVRGKAWLKKAGRRQVEAINLRRSDRVIVLSDFFRQWVLQSFPVPEAKVRLIVGGTDVERFRAAKDKMVARQRLGLPPERPLLLSVRRLAPRMGLDNLVRAMPAVVARCPHVLLLIGGKGPERERLERLVAELGLAAHVRLLGFIADDQLAAHYQAADAFVLPTLALEGFGLVTTESLACGTPVLGTPIGATPEILCRLDPRLVLPGTAPGALAEGITAFLQGGWRAELTPERLHGFVRENYTWDAHVQAMEQVYQDVIA